MGSNSCFSFFLLSTIIFHSRLIYEVAGDRDPLIGSQREALEIIIGVGGYTPAPAPSPLIPPEPICPPPPPPSPPPPFAPPPAKYPPNILRDYKTIQKFKQTITIDPMGVTKSWVGYNVCHKYQGFNCASRPDTGVPSVAAINFNGYNFSGPDFQIQGFVDKLLDLSIFHANSNGFNGNVPNELDVQNINFLFELDLSNNKYTGGFPMSVLGATNLTFLDIRFNSFSGPVPREVFNLDLDVLFLNNNQFNQQLPDNIGSSPAVYLTFANNQFSGTIPSSIGRAKNLLEVLFLNNFLTGCLPYEIGFSKSLTVFDASCNKLTGPIPQSFACLEQMQFLNLATNEFYGPVPEMVCKLPHMQNLSLSGNYFTEVGPECRKLIQLNRLDVSNNCISDLPNQRSEETCREFFCNPKQCPNEKSLTIVPCSKNYPSATAKFYQRSTFAATPPKSYDALSPHINFRF
ncbi:hypothetical protein P3X46_025017 [Hevea brasiliensis]|uniref:Leucine-rich repeat-containing N-terminal plant-type domain-containing protein n=1 Tax=Hevea brasiliensis TaxID=3981 RepID=A0ABQ9L7T3_HEVBR|nr:uncharacterized protein At4g06744-like [Hevea brasiliensis]KAJ9159511.1 hypothetical protein P3X46_025017 [Hevea brasiliensis]